MDGPSRWCQHYLVAGVDDASPIEGMRQAIVLMGLDETELGLLERFGEGEPFVQSSVHQRNDLAGGAVVHRPERVHYRACSGFQEGVAHADHSGPQIDLTVTA